MKFFICIALFAAILCVVLAGPTSSGSESSADQQANGEQSVQASDRFRKSAYGGAASVPAPPCPKNYLFSCQPNLAPVACAPPAYGASGAYSAPVPAYVYAK